MSPLQTAGIGPQRWLPAPVVVGVAASLQQRLAAGKIVEEQSGRPAAPPRLPRCAPRPPPAESHARHGAGPRVLGAGVNHKGVHPEAKRPVGHALHVFGAFAPGGRGPRRKSLGIHPPQPVGVGYGRVARHAGPSPVLGLEPKLGAEAVVGQLAGDGFGAYGTERLGPARAVGLVEQPDAAALVGQLGHVAIVVFGKEGHHHLFEVGVEALRLPLAAHVVAGHYRQPWQQVVARASLELAGQQRRPVLSAGLVAVYFQPAEGLPGVVAGNVEQHFGVALPIAAHGFAAHLVAFKPEAAVGGSGFVGLSVGGVAEAHQPPCPLGQLRPGQRRGRVERGADVNHVGRAGNGVGGHGQHGYVAVEIIPRVGGRPAQLDWPGVAADGHHGVGPYQFLHGILRRHRGIGTRRPPRAVVGAKRQAEPAALADGVAHQPAPVVGAYGVGRVARGHLHGPPYHELLHATYARAAVGFKVCSDALGRHNAVHPLPYHQRAGFLRRAVEGRVGRRQKGLYPAHGLGLLLFVKAVARAEHHVQAGVGIGLGSPARVFQRHHVVFVAVHYQHRAVIAGHGGANVDGPCLFEEAAAQRHAPHAGGVGYVGLALVSLVPVVGYAQCGVNQHEAAQLPLQPGGRHDGSQSALALADNHDAGSVDIGQRAHVGHDGTEVGGLVGHRHVHRVGVAAASGRPTGEVEGVALVAHGAERGEISPSRTVVAVEAVGYDGHGAAPGVALGCGRDAVDAAVAVVHPCLFLCECGGGPCRGHACEGGQRCQQHRGPCGELWQ